MTWYALFLRVAHSDCAIRGVQFGKCCVMVEVGNETCMEETKYELTNDNKFVIMERKRSV